MGQKPKNRAPSLEELNAEARSLGLTYGQLKAKQEAEAVKIERQNFSTHKKRGRPPKVQSISKNGGAVMQLETNAHEDEKLTEKISMDETKEIVNRDDLQRDFGEEENTMTVQQEMREIERAALIDQKENIKQGADTSQMIHAPKSVREALAKEEICLAEQIEDCTQRIREIQEFRKNLI